MPRKQEREQRKGRQGIMGQLRANQCEDHKDDRDACDQIVVDFVLPVAGIADSGLLLAPQLPDQPRQLNRPGKETDENRHEVERQKQQIHPKRTRPVTFHRGQRATNDMPPDSDRKEFAVSLN